MMDDARWPCLEWSRIWQHPTYPTNSMHRTLHDARELFSSHLPISVFPDRGQFCPEPFRSTHNPSVSWKFDIGKLNSPFFIYIYREREISNLISRSYDLNTTNINHAGPRGWNYTFGIVWDHRMGLFKSHDRLRVSINPPPTQRPAMWFRTVSTITDTPALVHLQEPVTCADLWKLGNIYIYYII